MTRYFDDRMISTQKGSQDVCGTIQIFF